MTSPVLPPVLPSESAPAAATAAVGPDPLPLVYLGHDLRAALAEMRSGLQLIRELDLPPAAHDTLGRCSAAGEMLSRLINQSVLVCLGQAAPGLTAPSCISTPAWEQELRLRWTGLARQSGHSFRLHLAAELPDSFVMDRTALDRILNNLLTNALRHTAPCALDVTLGLASDGTGLDITVTDGGPGFPAARLAALSFGSALPESPESRPEGGFGLHSVCYLVQSMAGRCHFANRAEGGAEIRLILPFADRVPRPDAASGVLASTPATVGHLQGARVLVGEDNATCREVIRKQVGRLGPVVTEATDGHETIRALSSHPRFDVLVLDDQMPGLSGLEVLHWINANLPAAHRPAVLILTAHATPERTSTLIRAGAEQVLLKPVLDPVALGTILQDMLVQRAVRKVDDDLPGLRRLAEIAGPEAARELFEKLGEDLEQTRTGLARAGAAPDLAEIRRHSHALIALAGTAGAARLHDEAVRLNSLLHAGAAKDRILALAAQMDHAIAALHATVLRLYLTDTISPLPA